MNSLGEGEVRYKMWLQGRVVASVLGGARSFREIVAAALGADPTAVRAALFAAIGSGLVDKSSVIFEMAHQWENDEIFETALPSCHPLDFEWRFSKMGVRNVVSRVPAESESVWCLGSTTAASLTARERSAKVVAVDCNDRLLEVAKRLQDALVVSCLDVTRAVLPNAQADVVIVDPPWYPEHICSFLWAAAKLCTMGAIVLLVLPGLGTRPSIAHERALVLDAAARFGLNLLSVEEQVIPYETPLFESNAFRAAGIEGSVRFWRRGDLLTFQCVGDCAAERPNPPAPEDSWTELLAGGVRIRFRKDNKIKQGWFASLLVKSLVPGDIFPTVSRRDSRRKLIDVWTSGNRVYACERPDLLYVAAEAELNGSSPAEAVERRLCRSLCAAEKRMLGEALNCLTAVISMERDEQERYDFKCDNGRGSTSWGNNKCS